MQSQKRGPCHLFCFVLGPLIPRTGRIKVLERRISAKEIAIEKKSVYLDCEMDTRSPHCYVFDIQVLGIISCDT